MCVCFARESDLQNSDWPWQCSANKYGRRWKLGKISLLASEGEGLDLGGIVAIKSHGGGVVFIYDFFFFLLSISTIFFLKGKWGREFF